MRCRSEERLSLRLRTVVSGVDRRGSVFREVADTLDFSTFGARLAGVSTDLTPGTIVSLAQGDRCARFRVTWVGDPQSPAKGQIGLHCIEVATNETKRILYVDDQSHELRSRASLLRTGGYDVVTVDTAAVAWQQLLESRFDLMILDYPVADADATAVVSSIREYWPAMRILVNTSIPTSLPEALLENVDNWIHKGVSGAELLSHVATLIGKSSRLQWPIARNNSRHIFETPVELRIFRHGVQVLIHARATDLSASGIGVHTNDPIQAGELATASFTLPDAAQSQLHVRVMARRRNGTYCGLEFVELSNPERDIIEQACENLPVASAPTI